MTTVDSVEMGERLKKQRLLLGYSRERLAEIADITPRFCYDLELGLKNMSLGTLCRLSDALHVSTDYILFGDCHNEDEFQSINSILSLCPKDKISHLEQIISHYVQAVQTKDI